MNFEIADNPEKDQKKTCKKCGQLKSLSEFSKLKSARDGLQRYCKQCAIAVHAERRSLSPQMRVAKAKKRVKLRQLQANLVKTNGNLTEAYKMLGTTSNSATAAACASRLLSTASDGDMQKLWKSPQVQDIITGYVNDLPTGTLSERRDGIQLLGKLSGELRDKSDVNIAQSTSQDRDQRIQQVLELVKKSA